MTHRLTLLSAVNRMLRGAGEQSVNSLTADGVNDTAVAEDILNETNTAVQLRRMRCNTVVTTYNRNSEGKILLPADTLAVAGSGEDIDRDLCVRGSSPVYLFDLENNTYVFDASVELKLTVGIAFEDLPVVNQYEISDLAARIYQATVQGDRDADALLTELAAASRFQARRADIKDTRATITGSSADAANAARRNRRFFGARGIY